jgi:PEP-CTERM motif
MALGEWGLHLKGRLASTGRATATRLLGTMAVASVLAGSASASAVDYNPAPTTSTGWNKCSGAKFAALRNDFCETTAFFEPDSLTTEFDNNPGHISVIFGAGFNAWNNTNNKSNNPAATTPQGWTLSFGGNPGGTFNVSIAKAIQPDNVALGGAQIQVTPNAALVQTLDQAVATDNANAPVGKKDYQITWVQGLYDNFVTGVNNAVPAFYEMDVSGYMANTAGQNPSYCASFTRCPAPTYTFLDRARDYYYPLNDPQAFFFGNAYIAIESLDNKSLVVYDGVDWGWHNYVSAVANAAVPEPATWALLLAGFGGLGVAGLRRGRARVELRNSAPGARH